MRKTYTTYTIVLFLILQILSINVRSQSNMLRFEHLSLDDGLSQLTINCLYQDSEGFIWIGTQSGLNKYSGTASEPFKVYSNKISDKNSLSDNWVYSIDEDEHGNLWIGTKAGLNKLNKLTGEITRYLADDNDPNSLSDNLAKGVLVGSDGYIWVKTPHELNKFDPRTEKFIFTEHDYDMFSNINTDKSLPMLEDNNGNIFVGSDEGLLCFDINYEQFEYYNVQKSNISSNIIEAIVEDSKGGIWVGTADGLNKFDRKTKTFEVFVHDENSNSISDNSIKCIIEDYFGDLWIGTNGGGLNKFNRKENKFYIYKTSSNDESISHNTVYSLLLDKSGILWVGTYGGGLDKANIKEKKIKSISVNNGLTYKEIAGMYIDQNRYFYVGLWGQGLDIIDLEYQSQDYFSTKHYSKNSAGSYKITNDFPHVIKKLSDGNIWVGNREGIDIINPETQLSTAITNIYPIIDIKVRIKAIIEDKKRNVWIGTENGLYQYDFVNDKINVFQCNSKDETSLGNNNIYAVIIDKENNIWIGTQDGLNRYDKGKGVFVKYYSDVNNANSLSNNNIYALHCDSEGFIWIATANGLNKFDSKSEDFTIYTTNEGLPSNLVYTILEDNNGTIWVSTGKGIASVNKFGKIRSYSKDDGSFSLEFNHGSFYKSNTGEIYFGGTEGISYFNPDSMKENTNIPSMVFIKLSVRKEKNTQYIYIKNDKEVNLTYKDNNFKIEFAALEYTNPKKNLYKYKIDGQEEWQELGNKNYIDYHNLSPGTYNIKIMGSNNDQVWNEKPLSVTINISSPIWQTKWAFLAYIILGGFIIFIIIKSRTKKLRGANQQLRLKQLASLEIAKQKKELEVKNKSITDSINYAKRIQQAMMPSQYLFKKLLPESFIFFKPKDVVSGDFYWISEKENKIYIAAVDCTGHGVPGAFMSIIGFDLLRNITKEQGVENPAEILNRMNQGVSETFSKNTDDSDVKDGMDLSIIVIDRTNNILSFAGAMNSVYVIRNSKFIEIKGNRFSVGKSTDSRKEYFDEHQIKLMKNDAIYIFSDGYPDQFGGQFGKKFKYRRFRHVLLTIHNLPAKKQREFLEDNFNSWRGELEQLDDVLVIGIKI